MLDALTFSAGYNTSLVTLGAMLLGVAAGASGVFVVLRKRALVSDAIAHATLPGVVLAFLVLVALGGDGRWLPGQIVGAACTAALGVVCVNAIVAHTRLSEDAAIGAVLSVFFGVGVVGLTVVQSLGVGRPAGLETFLLGSTAGMLASEALTLAISAALTAFAVLIFQRPMTLAAFNPDYAIVTGVALKWIDLAIMGLALMVTVIGLKVVGLVLVVALLIIPAVSARFWTERIDQMIWIAAGLGGVSGYLGAALSASAAALPTGPLIVLVAFAFFCLSLFLAPRRGALARGISAVRQRRAYRIPLPDLAHRRWLAARQAFPGDPVLDQDDGLTLPESVFTPDQLRLLDRGL
jgi:manganese/zinc/iron transport system permease protein